jgi:hypothetical protein
MAKKNRAFEKARSSIVQPVETWPTGQATFDQLFTANTAASL